MTELKTLKDLHRLRIILIEDGKEVEMGNAIDNLTLRQEAIKWVKSIRKRADDNILSLNRDRLLTVQGWILKFFNITEEDLK